MRILKYLFVGTAIFLSANCHSQKVSQYTPQENDYNQLFIRFKQYLANSISNKVDASDSSTLKKLSLDYLFVNGVLDSLNTTTFNASEISAKQFQNLKEGYRHFYQFFNEKEKIKLASHLNSMPIRLFPDKCIYTKLSPYQQANTFIYFDDRKPDQVLGYLLFVPKIPGKLSASRIMSSTLLFDSGVWAFKSFTGEIGVEYFLSGGIRPPDPETIIH
jgi:hypothetical protein